MRSMTASASQTRLGPTGLVIDENRELLANGVQHKILTSIPTAPLPLYYYCLRLMEWFPKEQSCFLWVSKWDTYPSEQIDLFEQIRAGGGATDTLIDAPGHLFEPGNPSDTALLVGLAYLLLVFNWDGYIVSLGFDERIHLGDECVAFYSSKETRLGFSAELANSFHLKTILKQ